MQISKFQIEKAMKKDSLLYFASQDQLISFKDRHFPHVSEYAFFKALPDRMRRRAIIPLTFTSTYQDWHKQSIDLVNLTIQSIPQLCYKGCDPAQKQITYDVLNIRYRKFESICPQGATPEVMELTRTLNTTLPKDYEDLKDHALKPQIFLEHLLPFSDFMSSCEKAWRNGELCESWVITDQLMPFYRTIWITRDQNKRLKRNNRGNPIAHYNSKGIFFDRIQWLR